MNGNEELVVLPQDLVLAFAGFATQIHHIHLSKFRWKMKKKMKI